MSGFAIRNVDSKIKSLLKMKQKLQDFEKGLEGSPSVEGSPSGQSALQLLHLPDDCLHHIISFLTHPKDVLNLGQTNMQVVFTFLRLSSSHCAK